MHPLFPEDHPGPPGPARTRFLHNAPTQAEVDRRSGPPPGGAHLGAATPSVPALSPRSQEGPASWRSARHGLRRRRGHRHVGVPGAMAPAGDFPLSDSPTVGPLLPPPGEKSDPPDSSQSPYTSSRDLLQQCEGAPALGRKRP